MSKIILVFSLFLIISCNNNPNSDQAEAAKSAKKTINQSTSTQSNKLVTEPPAEVVTSEIKQVTIAEAKKLSKQGYKFLDIRTPVEIERGKIKGAIEMNVKSFDFQHKVNEMDRDVKLIVYCSAGNRSALASKLFSALNFQNVVEMPAGYSGWRTSENK